MCFFDIWKTSHGCALFSPVTGLVTPCVILGDIHIQQSLGKVIHLTQCKEFSQSGLWRVPRSSIHCSVFSEVDMLTIPSEQQVAELEDPYRELGILVFSE